MFLCAAVGVRLDDLRWDAVKNTLDVLIIAVQPYFLYLLDGAFFIAFLKGSRQIGVFFLQRFLLTVCSPEELFYFFVCVSMAATLGIYFSKNATTCAVLFL